MWIIVATVILLYLLGFLFICFLNAEQSHGNPSTSDNNNTSSSSASNNPPEDDESPSRPHHRFLLGRLFSSNFRRHCERQQRSSHSPPALSSSSTTSRRQTSSMDLSRSALFAYRQQQLRQIHHEISEMSYLLGANQSESVGNNPHTSPVAISLPCPLTNRLVRVQPLMRDNRYSFIHQLGVMPPEPPMIRSSCSINMAGTGASSGGIVIPYPYSGSCGGGSPLPSAGSGSSVLSYSPGSTESCHIIRERQRRLRHIRMELEGLSLQLSHPSSDGTTISLDHNSGDPHSLIYFGNGGTGTPATGNGWAQDNNGDGHEKERNHHHEDDDLPGYESIVCLLNTPTPGESSSHTSGETFSGSGPVVSCSSSGMTASSSSDSWILIALTVLVVLLLFYLSKKMICNSTNGEDDVEASPVSSSTSGGVAGSGGTSTSTSFSDYLSIPPNLVDGFGQDQEYQDGEDNDDPSTDRGNGNLSRGTGYYCHDNRCHHQQHRTSHPQQPSVNELSSVSVIIPRKDVLEGQIRTQMGRIVEAEKEIQRLVQLLRVEEGIGMDCSQCCLANLPSPSTSSSPSSSAVTSPTAAGEATVEESGNGSSISTAVSTAPLKNHVHNIPPPPSTSSTEAVDEPHHHHQNNVGETTSPSSSTYHSSSISHRLHSESFPLLSNITLHNNNPTGNNRGRPSSSTEIGGGGGGEDEERSWSQEEFPFSSRPARHQYHHPCPCNWSRAATGANYSRRMLMLQRMLLLPPGMMTIGRGDFLPRITSFLPYNDAQSYYHHYLLRDPQSRFQHHHPHNHQHQHEHHCHEPPSPNNDDEPPPAYEECIKA